ncbi:undecaprenyl-diphosphatase [Hypnocyclicus thermotrophus]|uniref:Undecaprenyl-diphosphatase n=1 Tax=Hypnocyclicus thermotrophus TaxID=1627895 RepID=A0AA46DYW2_9FUSO|nr:phosphatase PAP2 family protein [Hypnocyclicus thermotrophus]TDT70646.1 undecaprenyl-diphosphatase [Hypnocyclicus thermotrophus]
MDQTHKRIKQFFDRNDTIQFIFYPLYILIIIEITKTINFLDMMRYVMINFFSRINIFYLVLILVIEYLIIKFIDKVITKYFFENNTILFYFWGKLGYMIGKGDILSALLIIVVIFIKFLNLDNSIERLFLITIISSIFSGIFVNIIKPFITRKRPEKKLNNFDLFKFKEAILEKKMFKHEYLSSPSGHTTSIFSAMVPLYLYYNNFIFIIIACFVGVSRIISKKHWTSDVMLGAVLGSSIGYYFYEYFLLIN